ncbi:MAG: RluA family pseudouridine synthase [Vicinamibacterales bacterium]
MDPSSIKPAAESMPLDVVFEDPWLIAVNKPAGLVVHPSYKNVTGTLLNGILARRVLPATPGVVTRLDKGTSGLVLVALTSQVHRAVQRDGANGDVRKEYLAVVYGVPQPRAGTISLPLARDTADRRRVVVAEGGAPSETRYEVIADDGARAIVRCELVTGRTHQIRVHLAARGWPIAGDPTYGRPHPLLQRQALHAWRMSLPHPLTRAPLVLDAPVAADIRAAFPNFSF